MSVHPWDNTEEGLNCRLPVLTLYSTSKLCMIDGICNNIRFLTKISCILYLWMLVLVCIKLNYTSYISRHIKILLHNYWLKSLFHHLCFQGPYFKYFEGNIYYFYYACNLYLLCGCSILGRMEIIKWIEHVMIFIHTICEGYVWQTFIRLIFTAIGIYFRTEIQIGLQWWNLVFYEMIP